MHDRYARYVRRTPRPAHTYIQRCSRTAAIRACVSHDVLLPCCTVRCSRAIQHWPAPHARQPAVAPKANRGAGKGQGGQALVPAASPTPLVRTHHTLHMRCRRIGRLCRSHCHCDAARRASGASRVGACSLGSPQQAATSRRTPPPPPPTRPGREEARDDGGSGDRTPDGGGGGGQKPERTAA